MVIGHSYVDTAKDQAGIRMGYGAVEPAAFWGFLIQCRIVLVRLIGDKLYDACLG